MSADRKSAAPYLHNCWYMAGWSHDLGENLLARKMLDQPIVIMRETDGGLAALRDECPHRFAPLSMGERDGNTIACPYHGLKFGSDGSCLDARYTESARNRAAVQTYPVIERHRAIWVWMGSPEKADPDAIPDFGILDDPEREVFFGTTYVKANYQLEIDNLLDLSHLDYVHKNTIAQSISLLGDFDVQQEGSAVSSNWRVDGAPIPAVWQPIVQTDDGMVDMWLEMRWAAPGYFWLDQGAKKAGSARDAAAGGTRQAHIVTPESDNTTHYFWAASLNPVMNPIKEIMMPSFRQAFEDEDRPMLEAIQERMGSAGFWEKKPIILAEDAAAVRARRLLDQLIRREAEQDTTAAS